MHIAIIMDGNGRWAKARHLPRTAGHKKGADAARAAIEACVELRVPCLTLYAFSSENWNRPEEEVGELMNLLKFYLGRELASLHKNGVRMRFIGDRSRLSEDIRERLAQAEELTANNTRLWLQVALSYGSRQEIVQAARALAEQVSAGTLDLAAIDEKLLERHLYTAGLPDPDLLIRTGGDQRISNFLLWQCAYTEFYFTDTLWPDFSKENLREAIEDFRGRERRFGKTEAKVSNVE